MDKLSDYIIRMIHNGLMIPTESMVAQMRGEIIGYGETPEDTASMMARQIRVLRGTPNPDLA